MTRKPAARAAFAPGDIMILVRSRGAFFEAMIRALKEADVKAAEAPIAWRLANISRRWTLSAPDARRCWPTTTSRSPASSNRRCSALTTTI